MQETGSTDGETVEVLGMCECQAPGAAQLPLLDHLHGRNTSDQPHSTVPANAHQHEFKRKMQPLDHPLQVEF